MSVETMAETKSLGVVCIAMATILMVALWRYDQDVVILGRRSEKGNEFRRYNQRVKQFLNDVGPLVAMVTVNTTTPVAIVDERFVSVGATMGSLNRTLGKTFNSARFHTVARGLAPAIYRIGGAEADFTYFDSDEDTDDRPVHDLGRLHFKNMTLHGKTWDDLHEFARDVGWEILFCLNALRRNGTGWDPTNAIQLFKYAKRRGHRTLWALGNEPNGYPRKANVTITGAQMATAFHTLRDVMARDVDMPGAFVLGPDTSSPQKKKVGNGMLGNTETYMNDFLGGAGNTTNVTSFHFYYTSGRTVSFFNFTDPDLADLLKPNIASVRNSVGKYRPLRSSIWITESGVTFAEGTPGLSENFVVGFLTLDKLGVSARHGVGLVVQQNLVGYSGGLLDGTFYPRLTYWLLLYHKRLMGTRVLDVSKVISGKTVDAGHALGGDSLNFTNYVRIYAHCTKPSGMYSPGSVTLMIINMVPFEEVHINVEGSLQDRLVHEYLFTPLGAQGILSPHASLSGQRLKMTNDLTLPYHKPRHLPARSPIVIPPQTYGFYVFPDAAAPACLPAS